MWYAVTYITVKALIDAVLKYIETAYKNKEEFRNVLSKVDETNTIMGFYTEELAEYRAIGKAEGKTEGDYNRATKVAVKLLQAGQLSPEAIADAIEKDLAFVLAIKENIDSGQL